MGRFFTKLLGQSRDFVSEVLITHPVTIQWRRVQRDNSHIAVNIRDIRSVRGNLIRGPQDKNIWSNYSYNFQEWVLKLNQSIVCIILNLGCTTILIHCIGSGIKQEMVKRLFGHRHSFPFEKESFNIMINWGINLNKMCNKKEKGSNKGETFYKHTFFSVDKQISKLIICSLYWKKKIGSKICPCFNILSVLFLKSQFQETAATSPKLLIYWKQQSQ